MIATYRSYQLVRLIWLRLSVLFLRPIRFIRIRLPVLVRLLPVRLLQLLPYDYTYGYYGYNRSGYGAYANGSVVIQVQSRLARAGYYRGAIDGVMGPRTRYAIQAYERDHGLRADGAISRSFLRNMGLRY